MKNLVYGLWSIVYGLTAFPLISLAQETDRVQLVFEDFVAPDLKANLMVTAEPSFKNQIQTDFEKATQHAREVLDRLDPLDPQSEVFQLSNLKTKGTFQISPDLARILSVSQQVALQLKEPMAKKLSINVEKNEVTFKSTDIFINIEPLLKGYLADIIIEDLEKAGWQDCFLELAGVFVAKGKDFNGPWKIPVMDTTTKYAQHAFFYKAFNTGAATVGQDSRELATTSSDLKSVTVFSEEGACKAQGLASAAYAAGFNNARKILKVSRASRSVLINQDGKFVQIPEDLKKE